MCSLFSIKSQDQAFSSQLWAHFVVFTIIVSVCERLISSLKEERNICYIRIILMEIVKSKEIVWENSKKKEILMIWCMMEANRKMNINWADASRHRHRHINICQMETEKKNIQIENIKCHFISNWHENCSNWCLVWFFWYFVICIEEIITLRLFKKNVFKMISNKI